LRVETQQSGEEYSDAALAALSREAREGANRWLARFAPLLEAQESLTAAECRRRVKLAEELAPQGAAVLRDLEALGSESEAALLTTLRAAVGELGTLEADLRRRLALIAPGDPAGEVDLQAIQAKLAETAARREVGAIVGPGLTPRLQIRSSPANWAAAAGLGVFGLGWTAFTTIHAVLFIGGFWQVIGPFALFFLLFYSMFWAVGGAMLWGAFLSACEENLDLEGLTLTVTRRLAGITWRKEYTLAPKARARRIPSLITQKNQGVRRAPGGMDVAIQDQHGREARFASGRSADEQERLVARINEYLAAQ
jgi:hypothetical protein